MLYLITIFFFTSTNTRVVSQFNVKQNHVQVNQESQIPYGPLTEVYHGLRFHGHTVNMRGIVK